MLETIHLHVCTSAEDLWTRRSNIRVGFFNSSECLEKRKANFLQPGGFLLLHCENLMTVEVMAHCTHRSQVGGKDWPVLRALGRHPCSPSSSLIQEPPRVLQTDPRWPPLRSRCTGPLLLECA